MVGLLTILAPACLIGVKVGVHILDGSIHICFTPDDGWQKWCTAWYLNRGGGACAIICWKDISSW
jgi:hypothetical protein